MYYKIEGINGKYIIFSRYIDKKLYKNTIDCNNQIVGKAESWQNEYNRFVAICEEKLMEDENKFFNKYACIKKEYMIVKLEKGISNSFLDDWYEYCFEESEEGKSIIIKYNTTLSGSKKAGKIAGCEIIAAFTYIPSFVELYTGKHIFCNNSISGTELDLDYLYLWGYLCERGCNNDEVMNLIKFFSSINVGQYNLFVTWGVSEDNYNYINEHVSDEKLMDLARKSISRYNTAINKFVNKKENIIKANNALFNRNIKKAFGKYKTTDECRMYLKNIFEYMGSEYAEPILELVKEPQSESDRKLVANILTHRFDKSVKTIDAAIRESGFEGEFPLYSRECDNRIENITFSVDGYDESMRYFYKERNLSRTNYEYSVDANISILDKKCADNKLNINSEDVLYNKNVNTDKILNDREFQNNNISTKSMICDMLVNGRNYNIGKVEDAGRITLLGVICACILGILLFFVEEISFKIGIPKELLKGIVIIGLIIIIKICSEVYNKIFGKKILKDEFREENINFNIEKNRILVQSCVNILETGKSNIKKLSGGKMKLSGFGFRGIK